MLDPDSYPKGKYLIPYFEYPNPYNNSFVFHTIYLLFSYNPKVIIVFCSNRFVKDK